jgi:glycosyltransferase involved in cell wall biosynthesis
VAISEHVRKRIRKYWGREAEVIHPPVDLSRFAPSRDRDGFYLMVTAFAPYKRVDLALDAFRKFGKPLKIVGSGQDEKRLRASAPANVEFLGWRSDEEIASLYSRCRAFVFPGEEDFGITPLEAQAAGRPVVALARGGAMETIVPHPGFFAPTDPAAPGPPTGVLFPHETADSLLEALRWFEAHEAAFDDPAPLQANAARFSRDRFRRRIRALLKEEGALPRE